MSANEPTEPTPSSWEEKLSTIDDPAERHEYAMSAVHEPLLEAQRRAKRVAELENQRSGGAGSGLHAATTAELIEPILGMWHR